ncbi:MAG: DUF1036 domain-containing protein [Alphaproteobacteria bacterium]|nr:DUF1036 domain-containing protein [Alphaproteobacteria bacterium]
MLRKLALGICLGLTATAALAAVPMDETGFTNYVQGQLQLYSPKPVTVVAPYVVSVGKPGEITNLPSFKAIHDVCVSLPAKCDGAIRDYVQMVAHDVLQKNDTPAPASTPLGTIPAGATQLAVCNKGDREMNVAVMYVPVGKTTWRHAGWFGIPPQKCGMVLQTAGKDFYARAENATSRLMANDELSTARGGKTAGDASIANSGGDTPMCVPHIGNWDDEGASPEELCHNARREPAKFKAFHNDGKPLQIWTLSN